MNKIKALFITSGVFIVLVVILFFSFFKVDAEEKRNPDSYWSKENAPVFYGATKIQFSLLYTTTFDIKDARFRIFATDFEDGDLTNSITSEGEVDVNTPGTYEITYKVKDSHNNETTLVVPVIVTLEDTKEMIIERTLYTIPNSDNITKTGMWRSTNHDRQILGIYLPEGKSFYMKTIDSDLDVQVQFDNRASSCEGPQIKALKDGNEVTMQNIKDGCQTMNADTLYGQTAGTPITTASVPLVNSNNLSKDNNAINKTIKIQIRFNVDEVKPLDYYHYKDNLESFVNKWQAGGNLYGIIDSERLMVEVPLDNIPFMYGKYTFPDLDSFLEYYQKVVDHYDDYIGLEINPERLVDQNVRVKYFVKANKNGGGAAYYSGNHVAVNSQNMGSFFERNWGGLHELAHGYQGSIGNGSMGLGEVSNNVLGHYAQIDKTIYNDNLDWLGKLPNIEETLIKARNAINGDDEAQAAAYSGYSQKMKLYMLVNLFDSFEEISTYKKLNKWYREKVNNGETIKNEDAYIRFFADEYNVNIIPYFERYSFYASSSVVDNILSRDLSPVNALGDIITNETTRETFMNNNNLTLKYGIVENSLLHTSGITTSLTINIDIDELDNIKGNTIKIKDGNTIVKSIKVDSKNVVINDLPLGTYLLQMPILTGYSQEYAYVTLTDSTNEVNYVYTSIYNYDFNNTLTMRIKGNSETYGYTLKFSDKYTKATVSFGGALIGANSGAYVKIYDENNNLVSEEYAKWKSSSGTPVADESGPYFNFKKASFDLTLVPGYVIEVKQPTFADRVYFWANNNDTAKVADAISGYEPTGSITRYIVEDGYLRREDMTEEEAENAAYLTLRDVLIGVIEDYKNNTSADVIDNRNNDFKNKSLVIAAYTQLHAADKAEYSEFVARINNGGYPVISYHGNTTYTVGDSINLYDLITATDNEDGVIEISKSNTTIKTNMNNKKAGLYTVKYEVMDNDSNVGTLDIEILFKDVEVVEETTTKSNTSTNTNSNKTTTIKVVEEETTTTTVGAETTTAAVYEEIPTTTSVVISPKTEEEKKEEETRDIIIGVATLVSVVVLSVGIYFFFIKIGLLSMM